MADDTYISESAAYAILSREGYSPEQAKIVLGKVHCSSIMGSTYYNLNNLTKRMKK